MRLTAPAQRTAQKTVHKTAKKTATKAGKKRQPTVTRAALSGLGLRRAIKIGAAIAVIGGSGLGIGWLTTSGAVPRAMIAAERWVVATSAEQGLAVDQVLVTGRYRTHRGDLLEAVGIERGMPLLGLDIAAVQRRVRDLPWVETVTVGRHYPDKVAVAITERLPMALWQRQGTFVLVDRAGKPIPGQDIRRFAHLPVLTGEDAPMEAARLLAMLQGEPALAERVRGAARVSGRRWNVMLDNGITIRLPEVQAESAWSKLAAYDRDHQVLSRDIIAIDLRFDDRLVVRVSPDAGTVRRDSGQNT
ncbi:MAG: cell division protein FtsQ/DivIB [Alphaproteobacteria bacterium]|nr:cell division protein FtsQ/DivIB [Alphaproteobacteria bacterium]